jgi:hypothetical protein
MHQSQQIISIFVEKKNLFLSLLKAIHILLILKEKYFAVYGHSKVNLDSEKQRDYVKLIN